MKPQSRVRVVVNFFLTEPQQPCMSHVRHTYIHVYVHEDVFLQYNRSYE